MKTKDYIFIGVGCLIVYLIARKKTSNQIIIPTLTPSTTPVKPSGNLNLPANMDLPSLTPTPVGGLPTEVALNNGNITPLIKDDIEPIIIDYNDGNNDNNGDNAPIVVDNPILLPTVTYPIENPYTFPNEIAEPMTTTNHELGLSINRVASPASQSIIAEPVFKTQQMNASVVSPTQIDVNQSIMANTKQFVTDDLINDKLIQECGESFSIANNDQENSYTNYWISGTDYYMQSTSPLIRSIPVKITKEQYLEGCKRFQMIIIQSQK